jgi:multidrug resistance efflux pump
MTRSFGVVVGLCACAWCVWFFEARVRVTLSAAGARVEAAQVGHRLQTPVDGYLTGVYAELGAFVERGQVLFQLDASAEERERTRNVAEESALRAQIEPLKQEIRAVEDSLGAQREATRVHLEEAQVRKHEAEQLAVFRESEQGRKRDLANAGVLAFSELLQSASDATQQRTEAQARSVAADRIVAEQSVSRAGQIEKLAALRREAAALEGKLGTLAVDLLDVERRIDLRRVRGPVSGRLGELFPLTVGSFVHQGDTLGTVIPGGGLRIVASLPPEEAVGRVRPGQAGHMRLNGFPWTQYGSITATVTHVAEEVRDGQVRVELRIADAKNQRVPLQHGMIGSIEIEIEHDSPAVLLWRTTGRALMKQRAEQP